jgi:hypothetical protein
LEQTGGFAELSGPHHPALGLPYLLLVLEWLRATSSSLLGFLFGLAAYIHVAGVGSGSGKCFW